MGDNEENIKESEKMKEKKVLNKDIKMVDKGKV
jgi:hypothetical protein